jgi:isoleucyl-tRNA synthetase
LATRGNAPYESVLTHGFTLDGKGRKMSKSFGNVIAPQEILKKSGAEILRLWVAAEDFREDVRISDEILNRLIEAYRRLRNTARFLISNLYDFEPEKNSIPLTDLDEMDRWILQRTQTVLGRCRQAYEDCEFHAVYHTLNNFCSVELSAQYLDIVKDRLYCEGANSTTRRAAQTTLYRILDTLVHLMAPLVSFTAEEIWSHMPDKDSRPSSVFLSRMPEPDTSLMDHALAGKWERIFRERSEVLKALEQARTGGIIGHSLDAKVVFEDRNGGQRSSLIEWIQNDLTRLQDLLIVSQVSELSDGGAPTGVSYDSELLKCRIVVGKADGAKCERCWKYDAQVGNHEKYPTVCARCATVLSAGAAA